MKDLNKLANETKNDLDKIGIKYRNVVKWSINTRAKKRWGQCKRISDNNFEINISELLLDDNLDDRLAKNVIAHELLHTVDGCFCHRGKWKSLANEINLKLPSYNIKTRDTFEEIQIYLPYKSPKYIIKCSKCSFYCFRTRKSKLTQKPYLFCCPKCGGKLQVFSK